MTTLADTSVWVDGLRRNTSWLARTLPTSESIAYTEPILMEVLMGARHAAEWQRLRRFVMGGTLVPFDSVSDFEAAAAIHWVGRRRGITVGQSDCLILAVAKRTEAQLVTRDQRQAELGSLVGIEVVAN